MFKLFTSQYERKVLYVADKCLFQTILQQEWVCIVMIYSTSKYTGCGRETGDYKNNS